MTDKIPLVTVYIPTFNRIKLLKRAVKSVLSQTYHNIELIIIDDHSTDGTLAYLKYLADSDNRIMIFQNKINSGACVSRNKAIEKSSGVFISGLDDDDYFSEDRIESFVKCWLSFEKNVKNLKALYSNYIRIKPNLKRKLLEMPKQVDFDMLFYTNFIGNQVFTKTIFLKNVLFDENLQRWQDLDCWLRLIHNGIAINTRKPTYYVDFSHEYGRITGKEKEKIKTTMKYFIEKYKLNLKRACFLKIHYYRCVTTDLTIMNLLRIIFFTKNFRCFCLLVEILVDKYLIKISENILFNKKIT